MEYAFDNLNWNFVIRVRLAYARRQNKTQNASAGLLVGPHRLEQSSRRKIRPRRQESKPANERHNSRNILGRSKEDLVSEESRSHHAPCNGFAMLITAIVRGTFQRMGKSVAKIENFPQAGFSLIAADHPRLDLYVARN